MQNFNHRLLALLFLMTPALVAARGCHFGSDEVSLGNTHDTEGGEAGTSDPMGGRAPRAGSTTGGGGPANGAGMGAAHFGGSGGRAGATAGGDTGTPTGGGGGADSGCYAPYQNLERAYEPGSVGCPCDSDEELPRCLQDSEGRRVALHCLAGQWISGEDGACWATVTYPSCSQPKQPGICANVGTTRYWHNSETGECEAFGWHCGGNENNFASAEECEERCISEQDPLGQPAACASPPRDVTVLCDWDGNPGYYYDPVLDRCIELDACLAGTNVYRKLEHCESSCRGQEPVAVIEKGSCDGHGQQITNDDSADEFTIDGTLLSRAMFWGCGCATRPEFVMTYTPSSPIELRLCHDDMADICEAGCQAELTWDLAEAFQVAGTAEFVFAP